MKKKKIAIIGCGAIANSAHIPAYLANETAEIAYFCDIIKERAEKPAKEYLAKAVTDYRQVLADKEVDAISVCTPNNCHAEISIAALEAGKHVLCEKPAARNLEEALKMQEAQHKSGKTLNIGVVNRFNDGVNRIKEYISQGRLGEVFHVYVSFRSHRSIPGLGGAFTTKDIAGGGVLIDWGVHFIDIVMYCLNDPRPITASGEIFSRLGNDIDAYTYNDMWAGPPIKGGTYNVEDSVTALVRTEGPVISMNGAWAQNIDKNEMYIDFMGDKGGIRLNYGADFEVFTSEYNSLVSYKPEFKANNHFQNEIDAFLRCINSGEKLSSHIDTAIITVSIMQAIYDSAKKHKEIEL